MRNGSTWARLWFLCAGVLVCSAASAQLDVIGSDPSETDRVLKADLNAAPSDFNRISAYVRFLNRQGRTDDAAPLVGALTQTDGAAMLLKAETAWAQGDSDTMRTALKGIPESERMPWTAGQELLIEASYLEGQAAECASVCRNLTLAEPLNKTARLFKARLDTRHGAYDEALRSLESADAIWRDDIEILECRAEALDASARRAEAQQLRRTMVDALNASPPTTVRALVAGATAMRRLREPRAALQCLELATSYAPTDPFALLEKSRLFRQTSQVKIAAAAAGALVSRDQKCGLGHAELAEILWDMKYESTWVEPSCERAIALDPELLGARNRLTRYALIAGDYARAGELLADNRKINPSDLETESLALASRALETTTPQADKGLEGAREPARVAAILGEICSARRDYRGSLYWYTAAFQHDTDDPDIIKGAGLACLHCGDLGKARELLEHAFARNRYDLAVKNTLDYLDKFMKAVITTRGRITVGYGEGGDSAAEYALYLGQRYLEDEGRRFGVTYDGALRVQLCTTQADLNVLAMGIPGCTSCGGPTGPDGALVFENTVFVLTPGPDAAHDHTVRFDESLHRAITECLLQRIAGAQTPMWLRDGIARYTGMLVSPEWVPPRIDYLLISLRAGKSFSLKTLGAQSLGDGNPLTRAYGALAMGAWAKRYGAERIAGVVAQLGAGKSWTDAVEGVLGKSLAALDSETAADVLRQYANVRIDAPVAASSSLLLTSTVSGDDAEIARARVYFNARRYDDVLNGLAGLLARDAPPTDALFLAGRAHLGKGDAALARTRIEAGVALDAAMGQTTATAKDFEALGRALKDLGLEDEAARAWRKAVELNPFDASDTGAGGELVDLLGSHDPKPKEYYEALELWAPVRRADALGRLELARWHATQGDEQHALNWYRSAAGLRPGWAEAHRGLAPLAAKLGAKDEAYASYRALIAAHPDDARALAGLQACAKDLGRENEVDEFLQKARRVAASAKGMPMAGSENGDRSLSEHTDAAPAKQDVKP